ncbi:hypothetical protein QTA58_00215 [Neorhizobium sp. CSC1952]|uniref:phage tail tip lysozyme n=1 Tax=Neorhizobium sp. CSC1952 TaxID=2978974 RepID=UPI0025A584DB|nr:phage tail tip lysozyme [Rhizobium sp. CSC1952]WJR67233.1 hypothetical protein QTA58_00215 [Rhizobium sp. CSC1952]
MAIASLLVPGVSIPQPNTSWLADLGETIGDGLKLQRQNKSFNRLADLIGEQPDAAPMAAMPSSPQSFAAPVTPVERSAPQGSTYQPFIDTVRTRVNNPYALSAIAATGRAESGWNGANADRTWADPSQSGQAGTSGGILSWRGPRLASLQAYAKSKGEQGNGSPQTQAEFFLQENPQLIESLNNAKSPQEAADIMANAWRFAGYDNPGGGEAARRRALAQNYYAQEFGRGNATSAAIDVVAPPSGSIGGFDADRFGSGTPVQGRAALAGELAATNQPQAYVDPVVSAPNSGAPMQAADASGMIAAGVTPVARGGVPISIIQEMLRDPNLRQAGLQLWQQNVTGKTAEPWQFVTLPDGTLARANQQTGEVQTVGRFPKAASGNGLGANEAGLNLVYGQDAEGNTVAFQPLKGGGLRRVELPEGVILTPGISNIDTGTGTLTINNRTGAPITRTSKDVSGAAQQKKEGENTAEAIAALPQVEASANQMLASIDSLANDSYLPNMLGPYNSRLKNISADSERVQSKMDQIGGQSFLQAYNALRGAGQITEEEGKRATAAMGRLNVAQNERDYREALAELRAVVQGSLDRARKKAGSRTPTGNQTSSGVTWSIEE